MKDTIMDPLRKKEVAATAEEQVRQWFISLLLSAGVPRHRMMSEVEMKYGGKSLRADLVIYGKDGGVLAIAECKKAEVQISGKTAAQALLYYSVLGAEWIFLTNGKSTYVYKKEGGSFKTVQHFPEWKEMEGQ